MTTERHARSVNDGETRPFRQSKGLMYSRQLQQTCYASYLSRVHGTGEMYDDDAVELYSPRYLPISVPPEHLDVTPSCTLDGT